MRSRTYDRGASYVLPRGGTLIVPVPCVDGIVVCADKRQNDDATGFRDDRVKVHEIPGPAVFTHHGESSLITKTGELVYDGAATALKFLRENNLGFDTSTVWEAIAGAIKRPYLEIMSELETPMRPPNDLGFNLVFFWFSSGKPNGVILRCTYGPVTVHVDKDIIQPSSLLGQGPMALGNRDVFNELREGNDRRFDELRQDPLFQRLFKGSLAAETSTADARAYAKKLIGVSSQHNQLVGRRLDDISPTVDCLLLRTDGSFDWLDDDSPGLP